VVSATTHAYGCNRSTGLLVYRAWAERRSDEQQTATSIRSGWPETFEGFYLDRYEPMVRLAALITRRRGVAEDIVQDVFLAVAPRWDALDHPDRYLRAAVVNRSRAAARRARREYLSDPPPDAVTPAEDPQLPQLTAVWRALGRCPPAAVPRLSCASTRTSTTARSPPP
jgi:DNA-directed RNA polymerase specialized sigma24 family protein